MKSLDSVWNQIYAIQWQILTDEISVYYLCSSVYRWLHFQPKPKKGKKKVAAAPLLGKKVEPKKVTNPLFEKRAKNFGIGK